jgi:protein gp37
MSKEWNKIGWCQRTINPVQGCPRGCMWNGRRCYAYDTWNRHKGQPGWAKDFSVPEFFPHRLKDFRTKEPMIIFIDSMSDIGYWEAEWLIETYKAMLSNPQNIYLALTKRYTRLADYTPYRNHARFFVGATVTNNAQAAAVIDMGGADFISFEPLLERIEPELLNQLKCRWWIVGDLTKNGKPQGVTKDEWVKEMFCHAIMDETNEVPFFMKESLRESCGSFIQEFPEGWKDSSSALPEGSSRLINTPKEAI